MWYADQFGSVKPVKRVLHVPGGLVRFATVAGMGRPLVLIPGMNEPWLSFAPVVDALRAGFSIHLVELRGHGPGRETSPDQGFRAIDHADDVGHLLRQVVGPGAILAGNSLGGLVAAIVAARFPDLVDGVVLEDAPFFFTEGRAWEDHWLQAARFRPLRDALRRRDRECLSEAAFAALYRDMPFPEAPGGVERRLGDVLADSQIRLRAAKDYQVDRRVLETACTADYADFGHAKTLGQIRAPLAFLAADPGISSIVPAETGDRVSAAYRGPRFDLVPCPGAGHEVHRDDPQAYVTILSRLFPA
jgi:pimeloyl-ACP methyl ester carboxylesterase